MAAAKSGGNTVHYKQVTWHLCNTPCRKKYKAPSVL